MDQLSPAAQQVVTMAMMLVSQAARFLVNKPEDLRAEIEMKKGKAVLVLSVPESEMAYLIGRGGRTAEALRTLTDALTARHSVRMTVVIKADCPS